MSEVYLSCKRIAQTLSRLARQAEGAHTAWPKTAGRAGKS